MSGSVAAREYTRWKILDKTVVVTTVAKEEFVFRIPTMAENARIGSVVSAYRRRNDPDHIGDIRSLDQGTADAYWGFAAFEILLERASVEWPFSENADHKPVVDHTKWSLDRYDDFMEVVYTLDQALTRFRAVGASARQPGPPEAVDSVEDPGSSQPMAS